MATDPTLVASIPVPGYPDSIGVSPDGRYVYSGSDGSAAQPGEGITRYDTVTGAVTRIATPGYYVQGVASNGKYLYATTGGGTNFSNSPADGNKLRIYDAATGQQVGAPVFVGPGPTTPLLSRDGKYIYVKSSTAEGPKITVIDTSTNAVSGTFNAPGLYELTAISADGKKLYGIGQDPPGPTPNYTVAVFDTTSHATTTINTSVTRGQGYPLTFVTSPDSQRGYLHTVIFDGMDGTSDERITVINMTTGQTLSTIVLRDDLPQGSFIGVGSGIGAAVISADGRRIYAPVSAPAVAGYALDLVAVDTATGTVVGRTPISGSRESDGIALSPDGSRVYVISRNVGGSAPANDVYAGRLDVFNTHTSNVVTPPPAPASGLGALLSAIVSGVTGTAGGLIGTLGGLFR